MKAEEKCPVTRERMISTFAMNVTRAARPKGQLMMRPFFWKTQRRGDAKGAEKKAAFSATSASLRFILPLPTPEIVHRVRSGGKCRHFIFERWFAETCRGVIRHSFRRRGIISLASHPLAPNTFSP